MAPSPREANHHQVDSTAMCDTRQVPRDGETKALLASDVSEASDIATTDTSVSDLAADGDDNPPASEAAASIPSTRPTPQPLPNYRLRDRISVVRSLLDMLHEDEDQCFQQTNVRLVRASIGTFIVWSFTMACVLLLSTKESYNRVSGVEKDVSTIAFILMLMSNISRLLPLLYRNRVLHQGQPRQKSIWTNGFFVASFTVQGIAMVANGLMAFFPTPVVVDPITGARVHMVRWSEWFPLGFLLTFLSEEIESSGRISLIHALAQGYVIGSLFGFVS